MMNFEFKCPQCGQMVEADESLYEQAVECPFCAKGIVVPRIKIRPQSTSFRQDAADALANRPLKSPNQYRIRQKSTTGTFVGTEDKTMREDAGAAMNIMLVLCFIVILVVGGGMFVASRCDKKCAALKELIEQTKSQPDEKISQASDLVRELKENHDSLSRDAETMSRRMDDIEKAQREQNMALANQSKKLEEKDDTLLERIESLSQQVSEISRSVRQLEQEKTSTQSPVQPQVVEHDEPTTPGDSSEESIDNLQKKLNDNLAEIKELVKKNPACYLNPSDTSIINVSKKIATMKDRRYCACNNITFVRDAFYCSNCKRVTRYRGDRDDDGCCNVSRKQSFYRWLTVRGKVDETTSINSRLNELYNENESLEKQIRLLKTSRPRNR